MEGVEGGGGGVGGGGGGCGGGGGGVADGRKGADGERLISGGRSDGCPV